jgi:hypothetical protein
MRRYRTDQAIWSRPRRRTCLIWVSRSLMTDIDGLEARVVELERKAGEPDEAQDG